MISLTSLVIIAYILFIINHHIKISPNLVPAVTRFWWSYELQNRVKLFLNIVVVADKLVLLHLYHGLPSGIDLPHATIKKMILRTHSRKNCLYEIACFLQLSKRKVSLSSFITRSRGVVSSSCLVSTSSRASCRHHNEMNIPCQRSWQQWGFILFHGTRNLQVSFSEMNAT